MSMLHLVGLQPSFRGRSDEVDFVRQIYLHFTKMDLFKTCVQLVYCITYGEYYLNSVDPCILMFLSRVGCSLHEDIGPEYQYLFKVIQHVVTLKIPKFRGGSFRLIDRLGTTS